MARQQRDDAGGGAQDQLRENRPLSPAETFPGPPSKFARILKFGSAANHRLRPILLTAAAAILGLLPVLAGKA
jgi:hypothetical protein